MTIAAQQVPGVYRRRVGDVLVTALLDGALVLPPEVFQGVDAAEYNRLLRAGGRRPPFHSPINVFLLQWPGHTVLIDAGAGDKFGPAGGRLPAQMQAAGVAPEEVSTVLLTHMHGDHVGGLLDASGAPAFPAAELVVDGTEMAFWHDDAARAAAPEARRGSFDLARAMAAPYAARTRLVTPGAVLPGVSAVALPGHSPGHTGYLVESGGERLLIWGDVAHVQVLQSARPDVTLSFDSNPAQAAETRRAIFERAAEEDLLVAGMHLSFPGFWRVARSGDAFVLQPEVWSDLA